MENEQLLDSNINSITALSFNSNAKDFLSQTAKWAKFLSIVSLIFAVILAVAAIMVLIVNLGVVASGSKNFQETSSYQVGYMIGSIFGCLLIGLLLFYPSIRLLQFAKQAKIAANSSDSNALKNCFKRLRSVFRFYGLVTIIGLVLYAVIIAAMLLGIIPETM